MLNKMKKNKKPTKSNIKEPKKSYVCAISIFYFYQLDIPKNA